MDRKVSKSGAPPSSWGRSSTRRYNIGVNREEKEDARTIAMIPKKLQSDTPLSLKDKFSTENPSSSSDYRAKLVETLASADDSSNFLGEQSISLYTSRIPSGQDCPLSRESLHSVRMPKPTSQISEYSGKFTSNECADERRIDEGSLQSTSKSQALQGVWNKGKGGRSAEMLTNMYETGEASEQISSRPFPRLSASDSHVGHVSSVASESWDDDFIFNSEQGQDTSQRDPHSQSDESLPAWSSGSSDEFDSCDEGNSHGQGILNISSPVRRPSIPQATSSQTIKPLLLPLATAKDRMPGGFGSSYKYDGIDSDSDQSGWNSGSSQKVAKATGQKVTTRRRPEQPNSRCKVYSSSSSRDTFIDHKTQANENENLKSSPVPFKKPMKDTPTFISSHTLEAAPSIPAGHAIPFHKRIPSSPKRKGRNSFSISLPWRATKPLQDSLRYQVDTNLRDALQEPQSHTRNASENDSAHWRQLDCRDFSPHSQFLDEEKDTIRTLRKISARSPRGELVALSDNSMALRSNSVRYRSSFERAGNSRHLESPPLGSPSYTPIESTGSSLKQENDLWRGEVESWNVESSRKTNDIRKHTKKMSTEFETGISKTRGHFLNDEICSYHDKRTMSTSSLQGAESPGIARRNSYGDFKIPERISKAQESLRAGLTSVRAFANGVEELKSLRDDYERLRQRLISGNDDSISLSLQVSFERIEKAYNNWWECAEVLINLGDGKEASAQNNLVDHDEHMMDDKKFKEDDSSGTRSLPNRDGSKHKKASSSVAPSSFRRGKNVHLVSAHRQNSAWKNTRAHSLGSRYVSPDREVDILSSMLSGKGPEYVASMSDSSSGERPAVNRSISASGTAELPARSFSGPETRKQASSSSISLIEKGYTVAAPGQSSSSHSSSFSAFDQLPCRSRQSSNESSQSRQNLKISGQAGLQNLRDIVRLFRNISTVNPPETVRRLSTPSSWEKAHESSHGSEIEDKSVTFSNIQCRKPENDEVRPKNSASPSKLRWFSSRSAAEDEVLPIRKRGASKSSRYKGFLHESSTKSHHSDVDQAQSDGANLPPLAAGTQGSASFDLNDHFTTERVGYHTPSIPGCRTRDESESSSCAPANWPLWDSDELSHQGEELVNLRQLSSNAVSGPDSTFGSTLETVSPTHSRQLHRDLSEGDKVLPLRSKDGFQKQVSWQHNAPDIFRKLAMRPEAIPSLNKYLDATKTHCSESIAQIQKITKTQQNG